MMMGDPSVVTGVYKNKASHNSTRGTISSLFFFPLNILLHTVYIFNVFMWTEVISSRRLAKEALSLAMFMLTS
jgi:hypothetical protein